MNKGGNKRAAAGRKAEGLERLSRLLQALPVDGQLCTGEAVVCCRPAEGLGYLPCPHCFYAKLRGDAPRCPLFGACCSPGRADGLSVYFPRAAYTSYRHWAAIDGRGRVAFYLSGAEALRCLGVTRHALREAARTGRRLKGYLWRLLSDNVKKSSTHKK